VKDNEDCAGLPTTFGSLLFADAAPAAADCDVVGRLRAAGAVVVGKTNLPEFAAEGFTSNLLFGTTRNPWNPERTPGGSSGGSAVAIAAGMAAIATATDGGGSIRIPAAYCGLFGLKPTNGVIGRDPIPDWIDYSTDGPLALRADDLRVLMDVLAGPTSGDPTASPEWTARTGPASITHAVAMERFSPGGPLPAGAAEAFASAAARFAEVFELDPRPTTPAESFPDAEFERDWITVVAFEHAHLFGRAWVEGHLDELTPSGRDFLLGGLEVPAERYVTTRRRRFSFVRALDELLGDDGVLLSPVMADDATAAEGPPEGMTAGEIYVTTLQNITGHPAVSLPAGAFPSGVPFGLQVTAPRFRDDLLLTIAIRWEEAGGPPPQPPGYEPLGV